MSPQGWGERRQNNGVITNFGAVKPTIARISDSNCKLKTNLENQNPRG